MALMHSRDRSKCPADNKECHNCNTIRHYGRVCKKPRLSPKTSQAAQVKHIQSQSQSASPTRDFIDSAPEYTPLFFTSPTEEQTEHMHQIQTGSKTIHKISTRILPICKLLKQGSAPKKGNPHIQPLWISLSKDSNVQQIDHEVDTGAGCNIVPATKQKCSLGRNDYTACNHLQYTLKHMKVSPFTTLGLA